MENSMGKCKNKATHMVPWGGNILCVCPNHLHAMLLIAKHTGGILNPKLLSTPCPCEMNDDL